jgi:hypothetical protein
MNLDRLRPEEIPLTPTPLPRGEGKPLRGSRVVLEFNARSSVRRTLSVMSHLCPAE